MNLLEFCMWSAAETKSITAEETIKELQERIDKAMEYIENVYNSLENVDRPILFYEKILEILKGSDKE